MSNPSCTSVTSVTPVSSACGLISHVMRDGASLSGSQIRGNR
ncbi:hypothetical protein [Paenibacillus allorhizoplanae]|nr:hypothetical protein [Paenibacillus allorhizoplanae]